MATGEDVAPLGPMRMDWRKRARECLGRSKNQSWRPRKRPRVKSFQAIRTLDNALALCCDGLLTWKPQPELPPLQRPFHTLVGDSGSENFALVQFLQRPMNLSIDFFPDPSHAVYRNFIAGLKASGLWPHTLMCMLAFNARHGPWCSDQRLWQVHESMLEYFEVEAWAVCPLFEAYLPGLIKDRRLEASTDSGTAEAIWHDLKELRNPGAQRQLREPQQVPRVRQGEPQRGQALVREGALADLRLHRFGPLPRPALPADLGEDPQHEGVAVRRREAGDEGGVGRGATASPKLSEYARGVHHDLHGRRCPHTTARLSRSRSAMGGVA